MEKQSGYKYQITQALHKRGWEIKHIDSSGEWWDAEHWEVVYEYDQKLKFFIYFILDPMDNKRVAEISAFQNPPESPFNTTMSIASIGMSKRKFNIKLEEFISNLEKFKRQNERTNEI